MATNSMVPYSNPAGNNQTTPGAGASKPTAPVPIVTSSMNPSAVAQANPYIPAGVAPVGAAPGGILPGVQGQVAGAIPNADPALVSQLTDIYGAGVGGALSSELANMSGTDSAAMQNFQASLVPQEAKAQANLGTSLGAGGVSANSSVSALGDANLQAQETGAIAGETEQLQLSDQQLTAQILGQTAPTAATEVADQAAMPWEIAQSVMGAIPGVGGAIGSIIGAFGDSGSGGGSVPMSQYQSGQQAGSPLLQTSSDALAGIGV